MHFVLQDFDIHKFQHDIECLANIAAVINCAELEKQIRNLANTNKDVETDLKIVARHEGAWSDRRQPVGKLDQRAREKLMVKQDELGHDGVRRNRRNFGRFSNFVSFCKVQIVFKRKRKIKFANFWKCANKEK